MERRIAHPGREGEGVGHTPGPWEVTPWRRSFSWSSYEMARDGAHMTIGGLEGGRGYAADVKAGGSRLVFLTARDKDLELETAKSNARLIAAAPTMRDYIEKRAAAGDEEARAILGGLS